MDQVAANTVQTKEPWHHRISLPGALAIAIAAAMLIVLAAYLLYWNDSNRKYDLARPGQQTENKALSVEDNEADTTSPVDEAAAKQKLDFLNKELKALNGLGQFNPEDLNDENIQLAPTEQPSL